MTGEKMKGEPILEVHQKYAGVTVREISPNGIRLEYNSEDLIKGRWNGNGFTTVYLWQKTDGTSEWESKGVGNTGEGDFIAAWGKGTGKNTGPTTFAWEGEVHFMSQSPKLVWLNSLTGWVEGSGDQAKRESNAKIYEKKT